MHAQTQERIRRLAFELSKRPTRAAKSPLENWLEAERAILCGLAEDGALYEPAPNTIEALTVAHAATPAGHARRHAPPR
jgi:hypothetical protein